MHEGVRPQTGRHRLLLVGVAEFRGNVGEIGEGEFARVGALGNAVVADVVLNEVATRGLGARGGEEERGADWIVKGPDSMEARGSEVVVSRRKMGLTWDLISASSALAWSSSSVAARWTPRER